MCRPKNSLKTASGERVARLAVLKPHENAEHFHVRKTIIYQGALLNFPFHDMYSFVNKKDKSFDLSFLLKLAFELFVKVSGCGFKIWYAPDACNSAGYYCEKEPTNK